MRRWWRRKRTTGTPRAPKAQPPFDWESRGDRLALNVRGVDVAEVFVNAGRGYSSLLADPDGVAPGGLHDRLRVEAPNREELAAAFLNELLRLFQREREIFCRFQPRRVTDTFCEMEVDGELWDPGRHRRGWILKPLSSVDVLWTGAPSEPPLVRFFLPVQSPPAS